MDQASGENLTLGGQGPALIAKVYATLPEVVAKAARAEGGASSFLQRRACQLRDGRLCGRGRSGLRRDLHVDSIRVLDVQTGKVAL